ncbi:MAG: hypothetical protein KBF88_06690 [Polyangiaceae bacterium]|nr:hypothetical protein [Polyangiaceae bacterium]
MTRFRRFAFLSTLPLMALACTTIETEETSDAVKSIKDVSAEERTAYIAKADIFTGPALSLASKKVKEGPKNKYTFNQEIACDFVEPDLEDKLGGMTPKFNCKLADGKVLKVKYSKDGNNDEVYSEIISSRILWLMGMPADHSYPVRVTCNNCPEEPWAAYVQKYGTSFNKLRFRTAGGRAKRRFTAATIEDKFDGAKIEGPDGEAGWSFEELPKRPDSYWGLGRAERTDFDRAHPELTRFDAMRMYAAWVKHADTKADNQRLVCAEGAVDFGGKCSKPLIMIHDYGYSYGSGSRFFGLTYSGEGKATLTGWMNQFWNSVWKDFSKCESGITSPIWSGTLKGSRVSNAGRSMIAERLNSLTDEELLAVFEVARVEEKGDKMMDPLTGNERLVTAQDWVKGFKWMRDIVGKACPEKP